MKFRKDQAVCYKSGGGTHGAIKWVGDDRGTQMAVVRWDATGALQFLPTDRLEAVVLHLNAPKKG